MRFLAEILTSVGKLGIQKNSIIVSCTSVTRSAKSSISSSIFFFFNDTATTEIYTFPTRRSSDLKDLDERAREWLQGGSGFVYERLLRDVGLATERRAEGLAAIDPEGRLTDTGFPEGSSTVKHAALLLCEWLADR